MENTIRIRTTPNGGDKFIKANLEQKFDFIEILSLKISQEEVYKKYCSDYGVIVGRVSINNGFGVENAKVSVFIPISDEDKLNPEIFGLYPYETISDKDKDGVRYNLLPKESDSQDDCYTPVGTFPAKREVLDNEEISEIYCKYYKFTTTTNHAGDFMIFGVPLGTYAVHVDADISNIGVASQRPYDLIDQGIPEKLFDSPTKFKKGKNLDNLVQIKSANAGVNVQPFWGDIENCEVGINRIDFDLNYTIRPAAIFMGSLFGDSHKNSVNMNCRPRKDMGKICESMASQGTIEIIRKTFDNQIEEFSIEGGRVIDDNGAWAFQIPMNLDYVVTDEFGNLIPSDDPNRGVPTRSRLRFRISMDESGGVGKLRTRAKYLVPHNPTSANDIDFSFGLDTKDSSFTDFYWNKIYSVRNFISRYQKSNALRGVNTRNAVQVKNVDDCVGDKTPFPYNRLHTEKNPLFSIICVLLSIMVFIVALINEIVLSIINAFIAFIDGILFVVCKIIVGIGRFICGFKSNKKKANCYDKYCIGKGGKNCDCRRIIAYIPCITFVCPPNDDGDGDTFAPGCGSKNLGFTGLVDIGKRPNHFSGIGGTNSCWDESHAPQHTGHDTTGAGYTDCMALVLAEKLNMFEFDFFNDWINGSLFFFLLKYKKRIRGRERFCEYDCDDFGGVDGNHNGIPDNKCVSGVLMDSCVSDASDARIIPIINGLVSKKDGELYYPPLIKGGGYKFYATDVINLGATYDCDWQGLPKLQPYLINSSYKKPPLITEDDEEIITCGMGAIGNANGDSGMFFSIDCGGLHVNQNNCSNIRKLCEIGVDIPESLVTSGSLDCSVSIDEIFDPTDPQDNANSINRHIRNVIYGLNVNGSSISSYSLPTNINVDSLGTSFNITNQLNEVSQINGTGYTQYRGFYPDAHDSSHPYSAFRQSFGNSYFFYFGLLAGRTSLDKMNAKYFTPCNKVFADDFVIDADVTSTSTELGTDGSILFTIYGGVGPFTYVLTGPAGFPPRTGTGQVFLESGLAAGTYTITVTDSLGTIVTLEVIVTGPPALYCNTFVSSSAATITSADGSTTTIISGGKAPYNLAITGPFGPFPTIINVSSPYTHTGLTIGNYTYTVTDSSTNVQTCSTTILMEAITQPLQILLVSGATDVLCNNLGTFKIRVIGGKAPYDISTTGPSYVDALGNTVAYSSNALTQVGLYAGTYVVTVVDISPVPQTATMTIVINNSSLLPPTITIDSSSFTQSCNPSTHIKFNIANGVGPYFLETIIDDTYEVDPLPTNIIPAGTTIYDFDIVDSFTSVKFTITDSNGCESNELSLDESSMSRGGSPISVTLGYSASTITATPSPSGTYTYQWFDSATGIQVNIGGTTTFTSPPIGTYYVIMKDTGTSCYALSPDITIT